VIEGKAKGRYSGLEEPVWVYTRLLHLRRLMKLNRDRKRISRWCSST